MRLRGWMWGVVILDTCELIRFIVCPLGYRKQINRLRVHFIVAFTKVFRLSFNCKRITTYLFLCLNSLKEVSNVLLDYVYFCIIGKKICIYS